MRLRIVKRVLFAVLFILGLAAVAEFFFHIPELTSERTTIRREIRAEDWSESERAIFDGKRQSVDIRKGVSYSDPITYEDPVFLTVDLPESYWNRVILEYESPESFYFSVLYEEEGNAGEASYRGYDHYAYFPLTEAIKASKVTANRAMVEVERKDALAITAVSFQNKLTFDSRRFLLLAAIFTAVYFVIFGRELLLRHLELPFFLIALLVGIAQIGFHGIGANAGDEHIHFSGVYQMSYSGEVFEGTGAYDLYTGLKLIAGSTPEENRLIEDWVDANHAFGEVREKSYSFTTLASRIGYVVQALAWKIARKLGVGFCTCIHLTNFANVLTYALGMALAISLCRLGKYLLFFFALMPSHLFMSAHFTYNTIMLVLITIGLAWFTKLYAEEGTIRWLPTATALGATFFGMLVKAIYAPLMCVFLFLPREKFRSNKERIFYRLLVLALTVILLLTFVLPTLASGHGGTDVYTDVRVQDASAYGQILYILSAPVSFLKLLFTTMWKSFYEYHLGSGIWTWFSYAGRYTGMVGILIPIFTVVLGLFQGSFEESAQKTTLLRIGFFGMAVIAEILVWIAMYLAFTPVGGKQILGVQGYYMMPMIWPLTFLFYNKMLGEKTRVAALLGKTGFSILTLSGAGFLCLFTTWMMNFSQLGGWVLR